jgi:hypothetical protein
MNDLTTRWSARKATPTSAGERYDAARCELAMMEDRGQLRRRRLQDNKLTS